MRPLYPTLAEFGLDLPRIGRAGARRGLTALDPEAAELEPEETESLLTRLAHGGLSALRTVGEVLGTPAAMVRSALVGKNPLAAIFNWEDRPTGQDVLRALGVQDPGLWSGFAADVALDPLLWAGLGAGAITRKAGWLAQKAGLMKRLPEAGRQLAMREVRKAGALVGEEIPEYLQPDLLAKIGKMGVKTGGVEPGAAWTRKHATLQDLLNLGTAEETKRARALMEELAGKKGIDLAEALGQPVRGSVGIGPPFVRPWATIPEFTEALDPLRHTLRWGKYSPLFHLHRAFHAATRGAGTAAGQAIQSGVVSPLREAREVEALGEALPLFQKIEGLQAKTGASRTEMSELLRWLGEEPRWPIGETEGYGALRKAIEAKMSPAQAAAFRAQKVADEHLADLAKQFGVPAPGAMVKVQPESPWLWEEMGEKLGKIAPETVQEMRGAAKGLQDLADEFWLHRAQRGLYSPLLSEEERELISYFPRRLGEPPPGVGGAGAGLSTAWQSAIRRKWREIPGGTVAIDRMGSDLDLAGKTADQMAEIITRKYGVGDADVARSLAGHIFERAAPGPIYGPATRDALASILQAGRSEAAGQGILDLIGRYSRPMVPGQGMHSVKEVFELKNLLTANRQPSPLALEIAAAVKGIKDPQQLLEYGISKELFNDLVKWTPERFGHNVVDTLNSLWRASVTSPWPQFHIRNFVSGQVQNLINGAWTPRAFFAAWKLLTTGKVPKYVGEWPMVRIALREANLAPTQENLTRIAQQLSFRNQVTGRYVALQHQALSDLPGELPGVPGAKPVTWGGVFAEPWRKGQRGWAIRGVGQTTETTMPLIKTGENVTEFVEGMNRLTPLFSLMSHGYSDQAAAYLTRFLQGSYGRGAFTPFENAAMRRLEPFYAFQRSMGRYVLTELSRRPGGPLAQLNRLIQRGTEGTMLPDYLGQGAAIPVGRSATGDPRFIGSLGLMHEQPMAMLGPALGTLFGGGMGRERSLQALGLEALSQTTPLVKGPMEWLTGKSFWQHGPAGARDIEMQDPLLGRILANIAGDREPWKTSGLLEAALANLPTSRVMTTVRQFTDPRKMWPGTKIPVYAMLNFLSPARVVDVSPKAQEAMARETAQQLLAAYPGAKQFTRSYIPTDVLAAMGPRAAEQPIELLALIRLLEQRAAQRARGQPLEPLGLGEMIGGR